MPLSSTDLCNIEAEKMKEDHIVFYYASFACKSDANTDYE
jgi:hypothetical protein